MITESPFWNRFKRNKLAIAGTTFIIFAFLIAILGYLVTPDSSPFANNQILSIAAKPPMFKVELLCIIKNQPFLHRSFLHTMLFGKETAYNYLPIDSAWFKGDSIFVKEYSQGNDELPFISKYHLVDLVYPNNPSLSVIKDKQGMFIFQDLGKRQVIISGNELKQTILKNHIFKRTFLLGTDRFGRDMLSRLIIGTRVSFSVGFISVFISLLIGISLGVSAGYYRGKTDSIIMWVVNVVWSVPTLLMVLSITLVLGKGFWQIFMAIGLTMWVEVARVVRGQALVLREKEFIDAARVLGFSDLRIIVKHILPNTVGPVVIISAANFASAILMEAGLSFLGIGIQPPVPSWGNMIKDHYAYIILDQAYLAILPGIAIMLMVLSFNFLGNGLRDAFDTKMS
jgi:peptide/nickel transport system permease protein